MPFLAFNQVTEGLAWEHSWQAESDALFIGFFPETRAHLQNVWEKNEFSNLNNAIHLNFTSLSKHNMGFFGALWMVIWPSIYLA